MLLDLIKSDTLAHTVAALELELEAVVVTVEAAETAVARAEIWESDESILRLTDVRAVFKAMTCVVVYQAFAIFCK